MRYTLALRAVLYAATVALGASSADLRGGRQIAGFNYRTNAALNRSRGRVLSGAAQYTAERETVTVKEGVAALKLRLLPDAAHSWGYAEVLLDWPKNLTQSTSLSCWVHGDGAGHNLGLQLIDRDGERWKAKRAPIDFTGWQRVSVSLRGLTRDPFDGARTGDGLPNLVQTAGIAFTIEATSGKPTTLIIDDIWAVPSAETSSRKPYTGGKDVLEKSQLAYLDRLMRDTFAFIDHACDPDTGIPTDFQYNGGNTNSTPVGLYIASLAVANRLGLLSDTAATQRFEKVFGSMERVHQEHGFFPNFFPADLSSIPTDGVMIISDYNIYPAGLIVARQVWPQYAERIGAYLDSIEWDRLYDKATDRVVAGYDLAAERAAFTGLWLASDARCAVTMMVGAGAVPPTVWDGMIRGPMESNQGTVLQPGFGFGGTYIAGITGLFLPEHDTEAVGTTVGNLGWFQYQFSLRRGFPLWGWSNCYIVGRDYTAGGSIPEWNVSPHSLAMLLQYYPRHVTAALQKMERLGGSVPPAGYEGKAWGLRGCYDMERNIWGGKYLQLEQGMMFLGLANFLHDGIVRKLFTSDPLIRKGLELSEPHIKHDPKLSERWAERDSQPIDQTPLRMSAPRASTIDKVTSLDLSTMTVHQPKLLKVAHEDGTALLRVRDGGDWGHLVFGLPTKGLDIRGLDRVEFEIDSIQGNSPEPGFLHFTLADKFGQSRAGYLKLDAESTHYSVPARDIYGFLLDDDTLAYINISLNRRPPFRPSMRFHPSEFSLRLKAVRIITKE
jgi:hypothetical protein